MEGLGQQAALKLGKMECDTGHKVVLRSAHNPSDVLWLDFGVSKKEQILRGFIAIIVILVILTIIYFSFTLLISAKMYINYRASPPGVICSELVDTYSQEQLIDLAGLEYLYQ